MKFTVINPKGNFQSWEASKLKEIKEGKFSDNVGEALFENEEIILWEITLKPSERLPFRRHKSNYSCNCFNDGIGLVRNVNGEIGLLSFEKGDYIYWKFPENEMISDFENIGETIIKIAVFEEKLK